MKVLNPNNLPVAPITEFNTTQGDLKFLSKDNYKKLKNTIEKHGFDIPVYAWEDGTGKKWLLDGHQRKRLLEKEGWLEPIPYLVVKAPDIQMAAERLLEITSQYGTITQEGLDEYMAKYNLPDFEMEQMTNFDGIFNFKVEEEKAEEELNPDMKELEDKTEAIITIRLHPDNAENFLADINDKVEEYEARASIK
jgi:ParB-like chromosome segregation protein Spo0J